MANSQNKTIEVNITDDIFNFLYPNNNDILSKLSSSDKVYMTYLLKQYYLSLRNKLNISKDVTFGLEIEFDNAHPSIIEIILNQSNIEDNWSVKEDGSLPYGGEVISKVLTNNENTWQELKKVCNIISNHASESESAGAHIHIGMHILGNNPVYWRNFIILYSAYENIIFRFLNGEYLIPRESILSQARPISKDIINNITRIEDRAKMKNAFHMFKVLDAGDSFKERRKRSINFTNISELEPYKYEQILDKNTIEFRSPNCTFNEVIWQNNINLLVHLFMYAKNPNFNEEIIQKRLIMLKENKIPSNLLKYSYIYTEQALELADLIFTNNIDKLYFLRQYIKSGEVTTKSFTKSKTFTKQTQN